MAVVATFLPLPRTPRWWVRVLGFPDCLIMMLLWFALLADGWRKMFGRLP